jgi:hypothetical protein
MNEDIMSEFKKNKFVIANGYFFDVGVSDANLVVLSDIEYWNDHYTELEAWCKEHGSEVQGMTVVCSDVALTAFILRWT